MLNDFIDTRQINLEGGAFVFLTIEPNVALALFYYSIYGRQSQTSSLAGPLCRKEGLKDMFSNIAFHTAPSVANRQHYKAACVGTISFTVLRRQLPVCRLNR